MSKKENIIYNILVPYLVISCINVYLYFAYIGLYLLAEAGDILICLIGNTMIFAAYLVSLFFIGKRIVKPANNILINILLVLLLPIISIVVNYFLKFKLITCDFFTANYIGLLCEFIFDNTGRDHSLLIYIIAFIITKIPLCIGIFKMEKYFGKTHCVEVK